MSKVYIKSIESSKRGCNQPQLQHKANETFLKALRAAHNSKIHCIFRSNKQDRKLKQTGNPDSYREPHSLYAVACCKAFKKNKLINYIFDFCNVLRIDLFYTFGFYSIIYFITTRFSKDITLLNKFDKYAVNAIISGGIIWFSLWLIGTFLWYFELNDELDKIDYIDRIFYSDYSFYYWGQNIFWLILTQLFRLKKISKKLILRILTSLMFVLTFERIIILITTIHRDYLPSSWSMDNEFGFVTNNLALNLTIKLLTFITLVLIISYGSKKIKTLYNTI
ncbi:hypothetical protein DCS32_00400 [Dokdonia sp. Dokd-P16]|uniref:hypothetical protein n=1 Tax=Dokdonia sp. Dokd-P16 TaxID=2173169 RepID=UPI000D54533F|nr:hypothetical protein [Dokdonia sp. Dokd-P16]AWH72684.1 hypothetical protein DCS32_00400 [Dokdonia sp. Dokd-P16]